MAEMHIAVKSFIGRTADVDKDCVRFDADTVENAEYEFTMPASFGSALYVDLFYTNYAVQSGTNKIKWAVYFKAATSGDDVDWTTRAYAAGNTGVDTLLNNQGAHRPRQLAVACSELDGLAASDLGCIKVERVADGGADDTMTLDAELRGTIRVRWTDA